MSVATLRISVTETPVNQTENSLLNEETRHDLVPWADPYIAGLVRKLIQECSEERAAAKREKRRSLAEIESGILPPALAADFNDELDFEAEEAGVAVLSMA